MYSGFISLVEFWTSLPGDQLRTVATAGWDVCAVHLYFNDDLTTE